ncbi:hypothetical protein HDU87_002513 [Geranomyces variabilis]|uniref:Guanylate cyclase domain-containing protein n=1 Tax=Geranomyces variabilis TaxID=109894 RepID=A0AAD5TVZ6_9FUNG|nr:hypothetical protein HDU87_002513 [Geranomyces variabilis]
MHLRESFVARHVRETVARGITLYPFVEACDQGAVVVADITGYSALACFLQTKYGDVSGARIQALLNPHFSAMVDAVHRQGGSVSKFSGDSLVAAWTNGRGGDGAFLTPCGGKDDQALRAFTPSDPLNVVDPPPLREGFSDITSAFLCCLELLLMVHDASANGDSLPASGSVSASASGSGSASASASSSLSPEQQVLQGVIVHIGLGCGVTNHTHIGSYEGGKDRCEYFVTGESITDASKLMDIARPNELAISLDCWQAIQQEFVALCPLAAAGMLQDLVKPTIESDCVKVRSEIFASNYARHSLTWLLSLFSPAACKANDNYYGMTRSPAAHLGAYISGAILHHLDDHLSLRELIETTSELRKCAVVFVRLSGTLATLATSGLGLGLSILQNLMTMVLQTLDMFDGCLRQFNVDEKGPTMLLVWGVNPYSHEEGEAGFALHAALRIARKLEQTYGTGCFSLGVAQGVVFSGVIGTARRSDHTILGVAVNEAARLMTHPLVSELPVPILVSEGVYMDCKYDFVFSSTSHLVTLKGFDAPKRVWMPIRPLRVATRGEDRRSRQNDTLVGRKAETESIRKVLAQWREDTAPPLVIMGQSGTGKSALAELVAYEAERISPGTIVCMGRASETQRYVPFFTMSDILTTLFVEIDLKALIKKNRDLKLSAVEGTTDLLDRRNSRLAPSIRLGKIKSMQILDPYKPPLQPQPPPPAVIVSCDSSPRGGAAADVFPSTNAPSRRRRRTFCSQESPRIVLSDTEPYVNESYLPPPLPVTRPLSVVADTEQRTGLLPLDIQAPAPAATTTRTRSNSLLPSPDLLSLDTADREQTTGACHPLCLRHEKLNRDMNSAADPFGSMHMAGCYGPADKTRVVGLMRKIAERVKTIVDLLDIDDRFLPLLNDVIPTRYEETPFTLNLGSFDRKLQLTNFIIKILNALTVDFEVPVVFILDNAQWMDTVGAQLMYEVSRKCKKLLSCWLSRPRGEYSGTAFGVLNRVILGGLESAGPLPDGGTVSPSERAGPAEWRNSLQKAPAVITEAGDVAVPACLIELEGLSQRETEELLLNLLHDRYPAAEGVDGRLVAEIYRRTGGNPVMITMLTKSLAERLDGLVVDGVLRISRRCVSPAQLDRLLPADANTAVLAHLDRTEPAMRHILLVASVAGQYTKLHTIAAALARNPVKEFANFELQTAAGRQWLLEYIMEKDRFQFLKYTFSKSGSKDEEEIAEHAEDTASVRTTLSACSSHASSAHSNSDQDRSCSSGPAAVPQTAENCTAVYFHHSVVYQTIYNTLIPSRRSALHASYAAHFARTLRAANLQPRSGNRDFFVATINIHLDRCRPLVAPATLFHFAVDAFNMCASRAIISEAKVAYQRIEKLISEYPAAGREALDMLTRIRILRSMCDLYIGSIDYRKAWDFLILAMGQIGAGVPDEWTPHWLLLALRHLGKQFFLRNAKTGEEKERLALRAMKRKFRDHANDEPYLRELCIEILKLLESAAHLAVHKNSLPCYLLVLLVNANLSEVLRSTNPGMLRSAYLRMGLALETFGYCRLAKYYLESAKSLKPNADEAALNTDKITVSMTLIAYAQGDWRRTEMASQTVLRSLQHKGTLGSRDVIDVFNVQVGMFWVTGNLARLHDTVTEYYRVAVEIDFESPRTLRPAMCLAACYWAREGPSANSARWYALARAQQCRLGLANKQGASSAGFGVGVRAVNFTYFIRILVGRLHLMARNDARWENGQDLRDPPRLRLKIKHLAREMSRLLDEVRLGIAYMSPDLFLTVAQLFDWACLIIAVLDAPAPRFPASDTAATADSVPRRLQAVLERKLCQDLVRSILILVKRLARRAPVAKLTKHFAKSVLALLCGGSNRFANVARSLEKTLEQVILSPAGNEYMCAILAARILRLAALQKNLAAAGTGADFPTRRSSVLPTPPTTTLTSTTTITNKQQQDAAVIHQLRHGPAIVLTTAEDINNNNGGTTTTSVSWLQYARTDVYALERAARTVFARLGQGWETYLLDSARIL